MSHSSDDSGNAPPELTMTPPQWVIDKAEQEKQEKQEKPDEDEVTSAKKRRFVYTREKKLNEWKKFYIELTDSDRVLDLIRGIRAQQGLEGPFSLYLGRESSSESITKDPSRTLGSLNLREDDVLVFRFGYYKRPWESDEKEEEVSGKKRRK